MIISIISVIGEGIQKECPNLSEASVKIGCHIEVPMIEEQIHFDTCWLCHLILSYIKYLKI